VARKSLVAARDLAAGEIMTEMAIAIKRPGTGLPPARRGELLGRKVRAAIPAGTLLTLEMFT
jgi:N-acetylneuraminate synthase/N,N'-diacetyllegionaminate synthase